MILWLKFFHLVFVVTWFAALFYLPRLFVYHTQVSSGDENQRFLVMEKKLYWYICVPSSIFVFLTGIWSVLIRGADYFSESTWLHIKICFVLGLLVFQTFCGRWHYEFKSQKRKRSERFFRIVDELPTIALLVALFLVVFKPI